MPRTSDANEAGFTLLEVLIAFAIVAALLTAILTLFSDTGRTTFHAEATAATVEAARSALERVGPDLPLSAAEVSWTDGPITVVVAAEPDALPGLWRVTSTAVWDSASTRLDSLKFDPDAQE